MPKNNIFRLWPPHSFNLVFGWSLVLKDGYYWLFELCYLNELFSNFPAEDSRVFLLVLLDFILNLWSGHSGLGSTNHSRSDGTSLLIPELKHFCSKHTLHMLAHTRGFRPGLRPGIRQQAISHLLSIFETQPCETLSCLEMTHGLTPAAAISMILSLMWLGRGRPLMKTPPNWLTRPCPVGRKQKV